MNIIFEVEELEIIQQALVYYNQVIKKNSFPEYLEKVAKLHYRIEVILQEDYDSYADKS